MSGKGASKKAEGPSQTKPYDPKAEGGLGLPEGEAEIQTEAVRKQLEYEATPEPGAQRVPDKGKEKARTPEESEEVRKLKEELDKERARAHEGEENLIQLARQAEKREKEGKALAAQLADLQAKLAKIEEEKMAGNAPAKPSPEVAGAKEEGAPDPKKGGGTEGEGSDMRSEEEQIKLSKKGEARERGSRGEEKVEYWNRKQGEIYIGGRHTSSPTCRVVEPRRDPSQSPGGRANGRGRIERTPERPVERITRPEKAKRHRPRGESQEPAEGRYSERPAAEAEVAKPSRLAAQGTAGRLTASDLDAESQTGPQKEGRVSSKDKRKSAEGQQSSPESTPKKKGKKRAEKRKAERAEREAKRRKKEQEERRKRKAKRKAKKEASTTESESSSEPSEDSTSSDDSSQEDSSSRSSSSSEEERRKRRKKSAKRATAWKGLKRSTKSRKSRNLKGITLSAKKKTVADQLSQRARQSPPKTAPPQTTPARKTRAAAAAAAVKKSAGRGGRRARRELQHGKA